MPFQAGHEEVICQAGSVRGGRYPGGVFIETYPDFSDSEFDAVVAMLGLAGVDSYDIAYDPETGGELYLIPVAVVESKSTVRTFLERGGLVAAATLPLTGLCMVLELLRRVIQDGAMPV